MKNTMLKCITIDNKVVYLIVEHIRIIYELSDCYSVVYGDGENDFVRVDKVSLERIKGFMSFTNFA